MGNVPCAVKHCLSYQQLLREHLWIGDSVAGALEPAQVPSRGPGRPHLSRRRGASPPGALLRPFCGVKASPLKRVPTVSPGELADPPLGEAL